MPHPPFPGFYPTCLLCRVRLPDLDRSCQDAFPSLTSVLILYLPSITFDATHGLQFSDGDGVYQQSQLPGGWGCLGPDSPMSSNLKFGKRIWHTSATSRTPYFCGERVILVVCRLTGQLGSNGDSRAATPSHAVSTVSYITACVSIRSRTQNKYFLTRQLPWIEVRPVLIHPHAFIPELTKFRSQQCPVYGPDNQP